MAKKGKFRSARIERAGNGYSVHSEHDMPAGKTGTPDSPMGLGTIPRNEPMVFQKKKHVLDHMSSLMDDDDSDDNAQPMVPATHPVKKLQRSRF